MAEPVKLIAGNWKMNGLRADGMALAGAVAAKARDGSGAGAGLGKGVEILICPPASLLFPVADSVKGAPVALGGQDCHTADSGAHTGDISAAMLADAGCSYVILGHSERRTDHGEGDMLVHAKAEAARQSGLVPIICVGETEQQRDAGTALDIVRRQLDGSVPAGLDGASLVIAYEPVWAIGTGRTPNNDDIAEMHETIRAALGAKTGEAASVRILYGGSVKPDNAKEILAIANVDGALVGGASLDADSFGAIVAAAG